MALQKDIKDKKQSRDCNQKKRIVKCVQSYERKIIQLAVGRWKDNVTTISTKEDGASTVIKRLRTRILRKAFDLYVAGAKYHKKRQVEEERCKLYNQTRDNRLKRQVYSAWILFNLNFQKQKGYWNRIYLRLETTLKQRSIKKWNEQTQKIIESEMLSKQHNAIS